jgi:spore germination protein GerM
VLRIDLNRVFAAVGGEEEILAVAQIVLTATSIEGVDLVAFQLDGVPTDVPVASGALSVDPVGAADYSALVAP